MAKILVVDDEPEIVELCSSVLEAEGYTVDGATEGGEALKKAANNEYDLIIVDLVMPGIDGLEIMKTIREKSPEIGIIVFTGFASVDVAVRAMKEGADDFLTKPVWNNQLGESVAAVLSSRNGKKTMDKNNNISERISDDNTSRNFRLLSGFSKEEYNEFVSMGRKEYFDDSARILLNHNDETILLLSGEAMLWNGDAPVYKMAGGDSVGEDNVLHAGNGKERFYIEVEPGSEVLRIAKDYIVNFFKDKDQKLFMRYAINIVGSQNLKLRHSYNEITKLYCRIHQTVF